MVASGGCWFGGDQITGARTDRDANGHLGPTLVLAVVLLASLAAGCIGAEPADDPVDTDQAPDADPASGNLTGEPREQAAAENRTAGNTTEANSSQGLPVHRIDRAVHLNMTYARTEQADTGGHSSDNCVGFFEGSEGMILNGTVEATWEPTLPTEETLEMEIYRLDRFEPNATAMGTSPLLLDIEPFEAWTPGLEWDLALAVHPEASGGLAVDLHVTLDLDLTYTGASELEVLAGGSCG